VDGILTEKMLMDRVDDVIKQHKQKIKWETEEEAIKRIPLSSKDISYTFS